MGGTVAVLTQRVDLQFNIMYIICDSREDILIPAVLFLARILHDIPRFSIDLYDPFYCVVSKADQ